MARVASFFDFSDTPAADVPLFRHHEAFPMRQPEVIEISSLLQGARECAGMVAREPVMLRIFDELRKLALRKTSVLIFGESGAGKELAARALHTLGSRAQGPLLIFNCSNLADSMAESRLFGHLLGTFNGSREPVTAGCFQAAAGGTLVLDEIGELPHHVQARLSRAVETGEIMPVGDSRVHKVDVRIVACTNRDLRAMVERGDFHADLYYRLAAASIHLPPLHRRPEDIGCLLAHFLRSRHGGDAQHITAITRAALNLLRGYRWPGNVRELANAVERCTVIVPGAVLDASELPDELHDKRRQPAAPAGLATGLLDRAIREAVLHSLAATGNNRLRAARLLGISRSTLYRLMARLRIES